MDSKADPVIIDLLRWLKDNLPPDSDEAAICKRVRTVQKVFDKLIGLSFQEFYNHAMSLHIEPNDGNLQDASLEESVNARLKEMKEYILLDSDKHLKNKKLAASRAKLDLKKEQYQLINSIRLDSCMDLISRYNHLISKK